MGCEGTFHVPWAQGWALGAALLALRGAGGRRAAALTPPTVGRVSPPEGCWHWGAHGDIFHEEKSQHCGLWGIWWEEEPWLTLGAGPELWGARGCRWGCPASVLAQEGPWGSLWCSPSVGEVLGTPQVFLRPTGL